MAVKSLGCGDKGDAGGTGTQGKSAYQVAVDNGYVGTESQWLLSINGVTPTLSTGAITTVAAGGSATGSISGAAPNYVVNIGVPTGATGSAAGATPLSNATPIIASTGNAGASTSAARGDHVHPAQTVPAAASATPLVSTGTGAVGNGADFARGNHVHPSQNVSLGTVALTQTAIIAINAGIREVSVALTGTVVGGRYIGFAVSYQLNGGAVTPGRPSGYALVDCVCNSTNNITVSLNAPLLAIGAAYIINVQVVQILV